jgi:hypothetical protein
MEYFYIISGMASIVSLIISVIAIRKVYNFEAKFKISQKAKGQDITQVGRDLNA